MKPADKSVGLYTFHFFGCDINSIDYQMNCRLYVCMCSHPPVTITSTKHQTSMKKDLFVKLCFDSCNV